MAEEVETDVCNILKPLYQLHYAIIKYNLIVWGLVRNSQFYFVNKERLHIFMPSNKRKNSGPAAPITAVVLLITKHSFYCKLFQLFIIFNKQ